METSILGRALSERSPCFFRVSGIIAAIELKRKLGIDVNVGSVPFFQYPDTALWIQHAKRATSSLIDVAWWILDDNSSSSVKLELAALGE